MDQTGCRSAQVPTGTPGAFVEHLNKLLNQVTSSDKTKAFLNRFGGDPLISTPDEAQARLVMDVDVWAEYIRISNIERQGQRPQTSCEAWARAAAMVPRLPDWRGLHPLVGRERKGHTRLQIQMIER